MSCQLVYAKSETLLHQSRWAAWLPRRRAKLGIVAQSQGAPDSLVRYLVTLSKFNQIAAIACPGPQYAYHIDIIAGHTWHILSCVCCLDPASADKEPNIIAHHLALTEREVQSLWAGCRFVTPAGVILLLEESGFWVQGWQGPPRWLESTFKPDVSSLVAPPSHSTWAMLTGHVGNRQAFGRSPYTKGCLVHMPEGSSVFTSLQLLHESDLSYPDLGWGYAFCTHSGSADVPSAHTRVFTTSNPALAAKAQSLGFPVLRVSAEFRLPGLEEPATTAAAPEPARPRVIAPPAPTIVAVAARPTSTNFAPIAPAAAHAVVQKKRGLLLRALCCIGRALCTFLKDVKDFVFSFVFAIVAIAGVSAAFVGLTWAIIHYILPMFKNL